MNAPNADMTLSQCRNCRATWDVSLNFCGRCGQSLHSVTPTIQVKPASNGPLPRVRAVGPSWSTRRFVYIGVALAACIALIFGGWALFFNSNHPLLSKRSNVKPASVNVHHAPEGMVLFYDAHAQGDGVAFHLRYLPLLAKGHVYIGWLFTPYRPDQFVSVRPLVADKNGTVSFESGQLASFNTAKQDLRFSFTKVIVTTEVASSPMQRPMGQIVLQGAINPQSFNSLAQLFVSTPFTPSRVALLAAFRVQMGELARWITNMLASEQGGNVDSVHSDLLRLIYVIEGKNGRDTQALNILSLTNISNEGDGVGLLSARTNCQLSQKNCGYIDAIRSLVSTLFMQGTLSTRTTQNLLTTLANVEQLTRTVQQQVLQLVPFTTLDTPTRSSIRVLSVLSDTLLNGTDRDGDGSIDPVPGEAATAQLYTYLQEVGAISLT